MKGDLDLKERTQGQAGISPGAVHAVCAALQGEAFGKWGFDPGEQADKEEGRRAQLMGWQRAISKMVPRALGAPACGLHQAERKGKTLALVSPRLMEVSER